MINFNIVEIGIDRVLPLQRISRETFYETFSESNIETDMQKYLEEQLSIQKLTEELENKNSKFYFAELDKNTVGYLKLNFNGSQTELNDNCSMEIERIYVLRNFWGKSIGHLLFQKAIEIAILHNVDYVWLGVWEKNFRAINFYKKNGFVEFDKHIFKLGNDEQLDIMMKLLLKKTNN